MKINKNIKTFKNESEDRFYFLSCPCCYLSSKRCEQKHNESSRLKCTETPYEEKQKYKYN